VEQHFIRWRLAVIREELERLRTMAVDDSKLEAAIAQLATDTNTLIAKYASDTATAQALVDKATAAVQAVDATVTAVA